MAEKPEQYIWSSYNNYIVESKDNDWLVTDFILGYFGKQEKDARRNYKEFVLSHICIEESPFKSVVASSLLGSDSFISVIKAEYIEEEKPNRELPLLRELKDRPKLEKITKTVRKVVGKSSKYERSLRIYISHKYSGARLGVIGAKFGIGESAVSQTSRRLEQRAKQADELRGFIKEIEKELNL